MGTRVPVLARARAKRHVLPTCDHGASMAHRGSFASMSVDAGPRSDSCDSDLASTHYNLHVLRHVCLRILDVKTRTERCGGS